MLPRHLLGALWLRNVRHGQVDCKCPANAGGLQWKADARMTNQTVTLHSVPEAQVRLGGLGKTTLYDLVAKGELETVKIGRRTFIPSDSVQAFIDRRRVASDGAE